MKRLVPFLAAAALVVVLAPAADAGAPLPPAQLNVTPNPATTDDPVVIGNQPGAANTCLDGEVTYLVMKSDGEGPVAYDTTQPDEDGNWAVTIDPIPVAGTFTVSAECTSDEDEGAPLEPAAFADFVYVDVELVVTQAEVPTSSSSSTTSTAAQAVSTKPTFTG